MSFFSEDNQDAYSAAPEQAATGPLVGFLDAFEVSYNSQVRGAAMYGIEKALNDAQIEQNDNLRKAGIENIPELAPGATAFFGRGAFDSRYLDVAKFYQGQETDPDTKNNIDAYDKRIEELRTQFPDLQLKTSKELWDGVRATAQQYDMREANDRRSWAGTAGSLVGGLAGSLNLESDPLNVATLAVGGAGRTAAMRIASQGGAQGLIEGVNQVLGVQEQRQLLGLSNGLADAAMRIGGAAIGGAALQGVGEGLALAGKRWFRADPLDPPPAAETALRRAEPLPDTSAVPPGAIPADERLAAAKLTRDPSSIIDYAVQRSPFGREGFARERTLLDMDYVTTRLDDWTGPRAWELPARTDTSIPALPASDFRAPDLQAIAQRSTIDDMARRIDPDTFRVYDKLAQRKQTYNRWIQELEGTQDSGIAKRLQEIDGQLIDMQQRATETGGKRAAKIRKDMEVLRASKQEIVNSIGDTQAPGVRRVREELMRTDEKMRDLAPVVSRAYARARSKWSNTDAERQALRDMIASGESRMPVLPESEKRIIDGVAAALEEQAPILKDAYRVRDKVAPDAPAADVASAILKDNAAKLDEALDNFRASLDQVLGEIQTTKAYNGNDLRARLASEFKGDAGALGEALAQEAEDALAKGGKVVIYPEGKAVDIVSVTRGMMQDAKGQRWGTTPLLMQKDLGAKVIDVQGGGSKLRIAGQDVELDLDNTRITVPLEDGDGTRTITVRELLQEQREAEYDLEAMTKCSI